MKELYEKFLIHLNQMTEEDLRKEYEELKEYAECGVTIEEYMAIIKNENTQEKLR